MVIDSQEFKLLYADDLGEISTLEEVQLIDDVKPERVSALKELIKSTNNDISQQALIILISWGDKETVDSTIQALKNGVNFEHGVFNHRIRDEDNIYDELAGAFHIASLNGLERNLVLEAYQNLLKIYPYHFFESKFKFALLKNKFNELIYDIENAILLAVNAGRVYQASQLLPVLSGLDADKGWEMIKVFTFANYQDSPSPEFNIVESLAYINSDDVENTIG